MDRLLKLKDAAKLLNMTPENLRRLAARHEVPCVKLGGEWRFPSDITARVLGEVGTVPERSGNVADESQTLCGNVVGL